MKALLAGAACAAAIVFTGPALAADVCTYKVTKAIGFLCPARTGQTLCLPQRPQLGACDRTAWCYGGKMSFCSIEVEPVSGPIRSCPHSARRLQDWYKCAAKRFPAPATATAIFTATAMPTNTPVPTAVPATATQVATPQGTNTAVPTGTVAAFVRRR